MLRLRNVAKHFGGVRALAPLDADCVGGQIVAVTGENGSGKTTLLNLISRLYSPDPAQGVQIEWGGIDLLAKRPFELRDLGVGRLFQSQRLAGRMTVSEHLRVAARTGEVPHQETNSILVIGGLTGDSRKRIGELSGGQQRLVALAVVLTCKPRLLLLDEPFAGLAPQAASRVAERLMAARDSGALLLIVDHNHTRLNAICDLRLELSPGDLVGSGGSV